MPKKSQENLFEPPPASPTPILHPGQMCKKVGKVEKKVEKSKKSRKIPRKPCLVLPVPPPTPNSEPSKKPFDLFKMWKY